MSLDNDILLLSRIPIFQFLNTEQVRLLAFSAIHRELRADEVLFREGESAASGFVVASGEIVLSRGRKKEIVARCEPGSLIGESALFVTTKRPATARASRLSDVMEINRSLVTRMLNEYPQLAVRMRAELAGRLAATISDLGKVSNALAKKPAS